MNDIISVDTILSAKWILPITPEDEVFSNCSLVIDKGLIKAIVPSATVTQYYHSSNHLRLDNHLLMPGLINTHGHAAMTLMRGLADDLPLMTWLQEHIWPTEAKWVNEEFVKDGTKLAIGEMIKSGTTCFSDMYFYPEVAADITRKAGLRAQIAFPILDFPTNWAKDADEYLHKGLQLHDDYRSNELINVAFGPHAPYTVSDEPFERIVTLANQLQAPIHIHVHETAFEVEQSLKEKGMRPLKRLNELGVLSPMTQCVHATQINEEDISLLSATGAHVIHCPESNLKLASGICPITALKQAGINVSIGTDGAASNNDLNMFGELTTAAMLTKIQTNDATAGSAASILKMATLDGAKSLGIDNETGSLEVGKFADLIAIDMNHLSCHPMYNIPSHLVYNNRDIDITHSWVAGKPLLKDGKLTNLDEDDLKARANHWQKKISGSSK